MLCLRMARTHPLMPHACLVWNILSSHLGGSYRLFPRCTCLGCKTPLGEHRLRRRAHVPIFTGDCPAGKDQAQHLHRVCASGACSRFGPAVPGPAVPFEQSSGSEQHHH